MSRHTVTAGARGPGRPSYPDRVPTALTLLDGVSWRGQPVPGDRVAALLAALAARPEGLTDGRLIELIWADDEPANPAKALQVLVSRVTDRVGRRRVVRYDGGYRLGVPRRRRGRVAAAPAVPRGRGRRWTPATRPAAVDLARSGRPRSTSARRPRTRPAGRAPRATRPATGAESAGCSGWRWPRRRATPRRCPPRGRARRAPPTTCPSSPRCCAAWPRPPPARRRPSSATRQYRARPRRPARRRPGPVAPAAARRAAGRRQPGARRACATTPTSLVGRDDDIGALRAAVREARVVSILGPGRPRQDPARARARPARPSSRSCTSSSWSASTSPDDVVGEVGVGPGRARLGERPADAHARAAQRRPQPGSRSSWTRRRRLLVLDNCEHVRRGRRRPGGLPACVATARPARGDHDPRAARDRRRAGLPAAPARARRRGRRCSCSEPGPRGPASELDPTRCAASWPASTGCRWPSSWPPPRCARCRSRTSTAASTTGSPCCAAATAPLPTGTRRWLAVIDWSWNLLDRRRAARAALGCRSSTTASRSTAPTPCSAPARSTWSSRSSTSRC